jgi:myo-inositol-1(or 4)-monophosphatase
MNFSQSLTTILEESADIARSRFGNVQGSNKAGDNNQVLTETDLEIGQHIIAWLEKNYPDHNIIDEEAGVIDHHSEFTWVVDPIDGTSNFANGVPTFGIMIGVLHQATPIAGGIVLPLFHETYVSEKEQGARCNGEVIHMSTEQSLLSSLVAYGIDGHQESPEKTYQETSILAEIILHTRNLRSSNSAFDIAMLVKGSYGAALNQSSKIWDNVAQHILVEEAGGKYTDFLGQPMMYDQPLTRANQNYTYCAAAPHLHQEIQEVIHSAIGKEK